MVDPPLLGSIQRLNRESTERSNVVTIPARTFCVQFNGSTERALKAYMARSVRAAAEACEFNSTAQQREH